MSTIQQRLRDERGLGASVASLRRWVRANLPEEARRAAGHGVEPAARRAGEQAQIDYGKLGMWLDPRTGRRRTVWAFVMVLACSRHMFVRPTLVMDQRVDRAPRRGVRVLRRRPRPAGPGQPQDRGGPARPLRPEDQPVVCRAGRTLRHPRRPGPRAQAQGQGAGRAADAVCPGLVLAGPGVHLAGGDAGRRGALVSEVAGRPGVPPAGRRRPGRGVRRGREAGAAAVAGGAVRAGHLVEREDRPGHPRQGRRHPLLACRGATSARRVDARLHDHDGAVLPPRRADQDPSAQGTRQADRLRRLPAGEDRLPHAHPDLVPAAGPPRSARPAAA